MPKRTLDEEEKDLAYSRKDQKPSQDSNITYMVDPEPGQPVGDLMAFNIFKQLICDQSLPREGLEHYGIMLPNKPKRLDHFMETKVI